MAITRTFGAVEGAGVQVNEVAGNEEVQLGALGTTVLAGVMERGVENDVTFVRAPSEMRRRCGGLLDAADFNASVFASLDTPLNCQHFLDRAKGAGPLVVLRVAPTTNNVTQDDRPTKSRIDIFNRETAPKLIGYIEAKNGGSWGGKRDVYISDLANNPAVDFPSANQIQLRGLGAKTLQVDEFKNGTVYLAGSGDSYKISANTTLGLLTLQPDDDVATDWGSGETYGSEESDAETFDLATVAAPRTIITTTETGADTTTIATTPADITDTNPPSTPVAAGDIVFQLSKDGGTTVSEYTVEFNGEATIAAILATINSNLPGCQAEDDGAGNVVVYTDQEGSGARLTINDALSDSAVIDDVFGSTAPATPTETAGTGDVVNHFEATAAELQVAIAAAIAASGAVPTASGGKLTIRTGVVGSGGNITITGSLATLLGFDGAAHAGTDGPADMMVTIVRDNTNERDVSKHLAVVFRDGGLRRATNFGVSIFVDGTKMLNYDDLSMQEDASNYWKDVINDDPNNDLVTVFDNFSGDRTAALARPANHSGQSSALTATRLTIADPHISNLTVDPGGAWVPTLTWNSWGTMAKKQRLKVEVVSTGPTVLKVTTDHGNEEWTGSTGAPIACGDFVGSLTVGAGAGAATALDYFYIYLNPLEPDECIGGKVFPNIEDAAYRNLNFTIIDNGVNYVDVSPLNDLTNDGTIAATKQYRIEYAQQGENGYDGNIAAMTTTDFERLFDSSTSPLRKLRDKGFGLVKIACPGAAKIATGVALSQKLKRFAYDMNWMSKIEIPSTYLVENWGESVTEYDLVDWVDDTFVRDEYSHHSSTIFPSFGYIADPLAGSGSESRMRLVPIIGMVLGEEARTAKAYGNHHKAPAGTDAKLPAILKLPVIGKPDNPIQLDHEVLNPAGVNILKWNKQGSSVIIWGDRTLSQDAVFKFYHKRCLLSQYEIDLLEGFDFTIFDINDTESDGLILAALHDYFRPEWVKRALRGNSFVGGTYPAAFFNMGADINTEAVRLAGEVKVEIGLRLADTIERLRIYVGPMGLTESS